MNKIAIAGIIIVVIVAIVLGVYFGTKGKAVIKEEVSPPNDPYVPNTDVSDLQKEIERLKTEAKEKEAKAADEIKAASDRADAAAKAAIESANAVAAQALSSSSSSSSSSSGIVPDYTKIIDLFSGGSSGTSAPETVPELPQNNVPAVLDNLNSATQNNTTNVNNTANSVDDAKNIIDEGQKILEDNRKKDEERAEQQRLENDKKIAEAKTLEERLAAERKAAEDAKKAEDERLENKRIQDIFDTLTAQVNKLAQDTLAGGISNASSSLYVINLIYSQLKTASDYIIGEKADFTNDTINYNKAASEIYNNKPNTIKLVVDGYKNTTRKYALDDLKSYLNQKLSQVNSVLGRSNEELLKVPSKSQMDYYRSELKRIQMGGYNSYAPARGPPNLAVPVQTNLDTYRKEGEGYLKEANDKNTNTFNTLTVQLDNVQKVISEALTVLNGSVGPGPTDLTKVTNTDIGTAISNSKNATTRLTNINNKIVEMKALRDSIKFNVDSLKNTKKEYLDGAKITTAMLDKFITDSNNLVNNCDSISTDVTDKLKTYQSYSLQALANQITNVFNTYNSIANEKLFNTPDITELNNIRTSIGKVIGNNGSTTSYDDSRKIANIKNASLWGNYTFALKRNMGQI